MIFCDNVLFSSTRTCEIKTGDLFSKQDEFVLSLEAEGGVAPPAMWQDTSMSVTVASSCDQLLAHGLELS